MKKWFFPGLMMLVLSACSDGESGKIDIDKVGKKFDSSAEKLWDSTKVKGKEIGNKIKEKINNQR